MAVGQFGPPSGVKGLVRLTVFTESPDRIFSFQRLYVGDENKCVRVAPSSCTGQKLVIAVEGISTREQAQQLSGSILYAARVEFPDIKKDKEYYQADLLGLDVFDEKEKCVGKISAFHNFGAGTLFEIARPKSESTVLVPFREDVIVKIEIYKNRMTARLQDWL